MKETAPVTFRLVPRARLPAAEKASMFELLTQHFDGVSPEQFGRDLAEKNLALLLENAISDRCTSGVRESSEAHSRPRAK